MKLHDILNGLGSNMVEVVYQNGTKITGKADEVVKSSLIADNDWLFNFRSLNGIGILYVRND